MIFMLFFTVFTMFACESGSSEDGGFSDSNTPGSFAIDNFLMSWTWKESAIELTVSAPTTGWVSVGFDATSAMKDADIIIGYVS